MDQIRPTRRIKRLLRRTWIPFFGRYGRLLPVQLETIPHVIEGENVMVVSPTASGKTEAVMAPVVEGILSSDLKGLLVLYISPTRALVNDMYHRLEGPLGDLGVTLSVKTSDRPLFNPRRPSNVLITTPESFDSLLCRHPEAFEGLKAVVLDEIHLVDNTYRGDQLRILLNRLRKGLGYDPSFYALSATVAEPEEVARRYFDPDAIVRIEGSREIDYTLVSSLREMLECARRESLRKLLVFCNKRRSVEEAAGELGDLLGDRRYVVVHHGSLDRAVRHEAEEFMRESRFGICVATMTLEIGIDIGDIDCVVIAEVPWSVTSLLQRLGRGNRRSGRIRAFGIYRTSDEKAMLEAMFEAARRGEIERSQYTPDPSVVVQQIFSILYGNPSGVKEDELMGAFEGFGVDEEDIQEILSELIRRGYVRRELGRWHASERLMNEGERGTIHSNIPDQVDLPVIDVRSQKTVGRVSLPVDEVFVLAGKGWRIVSIAHGRIYVERTNIRPGTVRFSPRRDKGAFWPLLPRSVREKYSPGGDET
ncbi:hypothetical protein DRP77_03305 [Candidatus Poribacteria bacterium]|nr:MAG: hypothetical protein DRP77_03305 [Candidatus Poribacteria bacterium]